MTEKEADEVILLLVAATGGRTELTTIEYFSAALQPLDYQAALSAATIGKDFWRFFPSWAEFKEMYGIQSAHLYPKPSPVENLPEVARGKQIPAWVRRWIAARFLYGRFGKERDMRPFAEMEDHADPNQELMPADAWVEEGRKIGDEEIWKFLRDPLSPDPEKTPERKTP